MFKIRKKNQIIFFENEQYGFKMIFTTRIGGYSKSPYRSLNLGFHTQDNKEIILNNKNKLYKTLNYNPTDIVYGEQIHSNQIELLENTKKYERCLDGTQAIKGVDGLIAKSNNLILGGHFADCLPVFIFDRDTGYFALLHAGWQGTYYKILKKAINIFCNKLESRPKNIIIYFGPAISVENYEVKQNLIKKFDYNFNFSIPYLKKAGNKYFLDLKETNRLIAENVGIEKYNINIFRLCTYQRKKLFFSYRRDNKKTGRMAAFISSNRQIG